MLTAETLALPRRTYLLPGESLDSLLARVSRLNFYDSPSLLAHLYKQGLTDDWRLPRLALVYERLASLTMLDPDPVALLNATAHRFAPILEPPDVDIIRLELRRTFAPLLSRAAVAAYLRKRPQYCPYCVKESAYHRLIWSVAAVSACVQHKCLLLDRCPRCGQLTSVTSITEGRCYHCSQTLGNVQAITIADDDLGLAAQVLIQGWLSDNSTDAISQRYSLPPEPPKSLFYVLEGLQSSIRGGDTEWEYLHQKTVRLEGLTRRTGGTPETPAESYCLYSTAFKGIVNWPVGFYDFIEAYHARSGRSNCSRFRSLGPLHSTWLRQKWQHPNLRFVQEAFDEHLAKRWSPLSLVRTSRYLHDPAKFIGVREQFTGVEVAKVLGISPHAAIILSRAGQLPGAESPSKPGTRLFLKSEIQQLRSEWQETVPVKEAAERLGVSEETVVGLVELRLLVPTSGAESESTTSWQFSKRSLDEVLCQAARGATGLVDIQDGALRLSDAAEAAGLSLVTLIQLLTQSRVRSFYRRQQRLSLGALYLEEEDLQNCLTLLARLSTNEVARLLGTMSLAVCKIAEAGLLGTPLVGGSRLYFERSIVESFAAEYVVTTGAARILQISSRKVARWARSGFLRPALICRTQRWCVYVFRREDVEKSRAHSSLPVDAQPTLVD